MRFFRPPPDPWCLDHSTADRLLKGQIRPEDAPPPYAPVAELFAQATERPSASELANEAEAVALFRDQFTAAAPSSRRPRLRPMVVAGLASLIMVTGVVSAAAAGALPTPAQQLAHRLFANAGISVPNPATARRHPSPTSTAPTTAACGQDTSARCPGQSVHGTAVCTVASQGTCRDNHGTTVCAIASDGVCRDNHGTIVCTVASAGKCMHAATGSPSEPSTDGNGAAGSPPTSGKPPHPAGPPATVPAPGKDHAPGPAGSTPPGASNGEEQGPGRKAP